MEATAIIVPVPETEPAVGRWRRAYTRDGAEDMPAHVTLLYPFVDDAVLVAGRIHEVRRILGRIEPFGFSLRALAEFPGPPPVLYLVPHPPDPFVTMTEGLVAGFPDHRPYRGRYPEVVPHLTIADDPRAPFDAIQEAVEPSLPVESRAQEAWVMRRTDEGWRMRDRIPLGASEGS